MHALASAARVLLNVGDVFDYGLDGSFDTIDVLESKDSRNGIRRLFRPARAPRSFQLKSSTKWRDDGDDVLWSIAGQDYDKLVSAGTAVVPVYLILLCLPKEEAAWTSFSEAELLLKHCCYYMSVTGVPLRQTDTSKQLRIPRANLLNAVSLKSMLDAQRVRIQQLEG